MSFLDLPATERVRQSCAAFQSNVVIINHIQLQAFAASIDLAAIDAFVSSSDGLTTNRFEKDISFPSVYDEAGFLVIAHGLDFGSGHRILLHTHRQGAGAWLTIRAGLIRMGQVDPTFSAAWLCSLQLEDVQRLFDLQQTETAALLLLPFAQQLLMSIQEFGHQLHSLGFATPGVYIKSRVEESASSAVSLVQYLVNDFPVTFNDAYSYPHDDTNSGSNTADKQYVYFYKKAQLVVSEIYMRFHSAVSDDTCTEKDWVSNLAFADIDQLTAFVDNVVVAMLRLLNIITIVHPTLQVDIEQETPLLIGSEEEIALRSRALTAIELIVDLVNNNSVRSDAASNNDETCVNTSSNKNATDKSKLNAQRLCNWLWGYYGKLPANRSFPRHLTPSTSFY